MPISFALDAATPKSGTIQQGRQRAFAFTIAIEEALPIIAQSQEAGPTVRLTGGTHADDAPMVGPHPAGFFTQPDMKEESAGA